MEEREQELREQDVTLDDRLDESAPAEPGDAERIEEIERNAEADDDSGR